MEEQQFNLREGAEIIIATPGRLKDVIDRHVLVLSQCTYVVMDEADRMVNLGFEVDLNFILDALPSDALKDVDGMEIDQQMENGIAGKGKTRVTTLFSATMPAAVERLAKKYLRKPAVITIGEAGRAVDRVEQRVEFVQGEDKRRARIQDILSNGGFTAPIIVFVNQKKTADMVARDLSRAGVSSIFFSKAPGASEPSCIFDSGTPQLCIPARPKSSERLRWHHSGPERRPCSSLQILRAVVLMCKTSHWLSTTRWPIPLRPMSIVSVSSERRRAVEIRRVLTILIQVVLVVRARLVLPSPS